MRSSCVSTYSCGLTDLAKSVYVCETQIFVIFDSAEVGCPFFLYTCMIIQRWATGWMNRGSTALGPTQPPIQWATGALSLGVKRQGREAYHSPPSATEVKQVWSYTFTPPYVFMAWCLVK